MKRSKKKLARRANADHKAMDIAKKVESAVKQRLELLGTEEKENKTESFIQNLSIQAQVEAFVEDLDQEKNIKISEDVKEIEEFNHENEVVESLEELNQIEDSSETVESLKVFDQIEETFVLEEVLEEEQEEASFTKEDREKKFEERFSLYYDELKWLYTELYGETPYLDELKNGMRGFFIDRNPKLIHMDYAREQADLPWYEKANFVGMTMDIDQFAGSFKAVEEKINYLKEMKIGYLNFMPFLKTQKDRNNSNYAVTNFREVDEKLGTIEELEHLLDTCHKNQIYVCMDFILSHTSDQHEWALKAKQGQQEYKERYICYEDYDIPAQLEESLAQIFPQTAPKNFVWNEELNSFVFSSFYPDEWDLNYKNPVVLNQIIYSMLYLANQGIDVFNIKELPYIWKEVDSQCKNLPQVHNIIRIMQIVCQIVCPAVLLKGSITMDPQEVIPYFGTTQKPECNMLYNVPSMVCIWNSLATRDTRLLKWQLDTMHFLPKNDMFINYVRSQDEIEWRLDETSLQYLGFDPVEHRKFLYHFYEGTFPNSFSCGETFNYNEDTKEAKICGTTASLCGIEEALLKQDKQKLEMAIQRDLMIHAFVLSMRGIPMIYSGDEIGSLNDYSYKEDFKTSGDARYLHRKAFSWEDCEKRKDNTKVQGRLFESLKKMIEIRSQYSAFDLDAYTEALEFTDLALLGIKREKDGERIYCFYNFSEHEMEMYLEKGMYTSLLEEDKCYEESVNIQPYTYLWLKVKE